MIVVVGGTVHQKILDESILVWLLRLKRLQELHVQIIAAVTLRGTSLGGRPNTSLMLRLLLPIVNLLQQACEAGLLTSSAAEAGTEVITRHNRGRLK